MARTFTKNVIRAITGNPARFLAIFGIVAIGAGVFAGLRAFVPDMYASADAFYDGQNFADIQVVSALGLTEDDVAAVSGVDGVAGAVGVSSYETVMSASDGTPLQVQVESLPMARYEAAYGEPQCPADVVSQLVVRQGRLPRGPGEIVVSSNGRLKDETVRVGDVLTAHEVMGVGDAAGVYAATEFAVVGIVSSPEWLCVSTGLSPTSGARVTNYAYVDRSSLMRPDLYTAVVATVSEARGRMAFTDEYDAAVASVRDAVKAVARQRERVRHDELLARADETLEAARGFADQAGAVDLALRLLPEKTDLADLAAGSPEGERLVSMLDELAPGSSVVASREGISVDGEKPVSAAELAALVVEKARLARDNLEPAPWYVLTRDANPSYYVYKATAQRMNRICLIFPAFFFLVAALVSLTTMGRMVENDRVEIGTLKALGYSRAATSAKYLAFSGIASTLGAVVGIAVGAFALPLAIWTPYSVMYLEFEFLTGPDWPSSATALAVSVALACGACAAAASKTLREPAARLLLPAAPKSGRHILLERVGPLWRRMGFSQKVAARNVFRYKPRMVMTVVGVAGCCGLMLCGFGVQNRLDGFVEAQYGGIYRFDVQAVFDREADPLASAGDARAPLSRELDDVLGKGRWTYLLKRACVAANPSGDPTSVPYGIGGRLDRTGGSVQAEMREARSDRAGDEGEGILRDAAVMVLPDGADQQFVVIEGTDGGRLELPGQEGGSTGALVSGDDGVGLPGAVVTSRLAEQLMVGVGDEVEIELSDSGSRATVRVFGVMRNFVGHFVYMSPAAWRAAFGPEDDEAALGYNQVLGFAPPGTEALPDAPDAIELKDRIARSSDAVSSVTLALEESDGYEDIANSLNSIVGILLAVSAALAFIVVFALTEINVEERRREIATLKVLGFTPREVRAYVYRETYALAALGIVCGLPFGAWLCDFAMRSAEFDNVVYFRTQEPWCYVAAAALTAAAVVVVTLAMRRRLAGIEMVASLKSVD